MNFGKLVKVRVFQYLASDAINTAGPARLKTWQLPWLVYAKSKSNYAQQAVYYPPKDAKAILLKRHKRQHLWRNASNLRCITEDGTCPYSVALTQSNSSCCQTLARSDANQTGRCTIHQNWQAKIYNMQLPADSSAAKSLPTIILYKPRMLRCCQQTPVAEAWLGFTLIDSCQVGARVHEPVPTAGPWCTAMQYIAGSPACLLVGQ